MTLALLLTGIVLLYALGLVFTWGLCRAASLEPRDQEGGTPSTTPRLKPGA